MPNILYNNKVYKSNKTNIISFNKNINISYNNINNKNNIDYTRHFPPANIE